MDDGDPLSGCGFALGVGEPGGSATSLVLPVLSAVEGSNAEGATTGGGSRGVVPPCPSAPLRPLGGRSEGASLPLCSPEVAGAVGAVGSGLLTPLLAVLVDGLRHDYINRKDAPFLWQLEQEGFSGCVRECFAGQLRPAFLAGLYPNRSGIGHLFCYDPDNSPFRAARYVPAWAAGLPRVGPRLRDWVVQRARTSEMARGHDASARYAYAAEIPWSSLTRFAFSERHAPTSPDVYPSPSLFDLLREARMEWLYVGYPYDKQETDSILASFHSRWRGMEHLVFLHFAEVDWYGHVGPNSSARRCALRRIDSAVDEIYRCMCSGETSPHVLVFGDHGMAEVHEVVNILPTLARISPGAGRRYSFFVDSTVARFWFHHPAARQAVQQVLQTVRTGSILDQQALERYGLDGAPRELGELFFAVPAGTVLFPNFFQVTTPPKGMHGYLPEEKENWGRVLLRSQGLKGELPRPVDLVDIFPAMVTLLGLNVPPGCQGRSFLDDVHTAAPKTEKH